MLILLTSQENENDVFKGDLVWGYAVKHKASGVGRLNGAGWLRAYEGLHVAAFMNPLHDAIDEPVAWKCKGDVGKRDGQLRCGCTSLKTLKQVYLPVITPQQRIDIAVRLAAYVARDKYPEWATWAAEWLSSNTKAECMANEGDACLDVWADGVCNPTAVTNAIMHAVQTIHASGKENITRSSGLAVKYALDADPGIDLEKSIRNVCRK